MKTKALKRATSWLLALMVALVVAPGMALANPATAMAEGPELEVTHDTSKDDVAWTDQATEDQQAEVVLTVFTKYADEDAISAKKFTRSDLIAMANENTKVLGYAYQNAVYVVDKYVTIEQLMKKVGKKGLTITDQDEVIIGTSTGPFGKGKFTNAAFEASDGTTTFQYPGFSTVGQFFPGVTYDGAKWSFANLENPIDAPAIIALSYAEGKWSENANAAAAAICNELRPYYGGSLRLFSGTTAELLSGDSAALPMGKISPNGITDITVATPASDAFAVYSQEGESGQPKLAKEYTRTTLEALATDGAKGFLFMSGETWSVGVTTKSIAVDALLKDAGLALEEGDSLVFAAPDGFKSTMTYEAVQSEKYLYPAAAEATTDASDPVEVGTVLALNWKTASVAGTAGATMSEVATGALTNQYRVFCGVSEENFLAKKAAGNRFATDPKTLTLIKAEKPADVTPPAPAAKPAAKATQTVTVAKKTINLKAKALKKKAQTVKASKVTKGNKAQTSLTYKLVKANKSKAKFKVASNGKITVKKGLKKGTYKLTIKATAAENAAYTAASKSFVVTIKVK